MSNGYKTGLAHAAEQATSVRFTLPLAFAGASAQPNLGPNEKQAPDARPGTALGYKASLALAAGQAPDVRPLIMLPISAISTSQTASLAKRPTPIVAPQSVHSMPEMARTIPDHTTAISITQGQAQAQESKPQHHSNPTAYPGKPLPQPPPGWMKQYKRTMRDFDGACLDFLKLPQVERLLNLAIGSSHKGNAAIGPLKDDPIHDNFHAHRNLSISDPKIAGQPIQLRSRHFSLGPRGMSVGACQFINLPQSADANKPQLHLSTRPGPDGRPTFVLEYATALISEETGEAAYIFAATVDVTLFIREQVARLLATDEEYAEIAALGHAPRRNRVAEKPRERRKCIQIQQKDSGVFIDPGRNYSRRDLSRMPAGTGKVERRYAFGPEVRIQHHPEADGAVDDEEEEEVESPIDWLQLDDFPVPPVTDRLPALPENVEMSLQKLFAYAVMQYHDAFVLTSTATLRSSSSQKTKGEQWLISYTIPALHKRRKDLAVALSKSGEGVLRLLGGKLAGETDVETDIVWGVRGEKKTLKAVPMMRDGRSGGGVACWICFLLDL